MIRLHEAIEVARKSRGAPLERAVCWIGQKSAARELKQFHIMPRRIVSAIRKLDLMAIWNAVTKDRTNSQKYWSKIIAIWWILDGESNSVRIVKGLDEHYWVEMDFPAETFIFDWNISDYGERKGWPPTLQNLHENRVKTGDMLAIVSRYLRNYDFVNSGLYGVADLDVERPLSLKFIRDRTGWSQNDINSIREQCSVLYSEYETWRKVSPVKIPAI